MRKLVTPADPKASIPDLDRGGFLPASGRVVSWTPYWAGMLARQEISVAEAPAEVTEPEVAPTGAPQGAEVPAPDSPPAPDAEHEDAPAA